MLKKIRRCLIVVCSLPLLRSHPEEVTMMIVWWWSEVRCRRRKLSPPLKSSMESIGRSIPIYLFHIQVTNFSSIYAKIMLFVQMFDHFAVKFNYCAWMCHFSLYFYSFFKLICRTRSYKTFFFTTEEFFRFYWKACMFVT